MVAEAHRILMRGGVFMYPRDTKDPSKPGRLRLLYEANPIGFIIEQAGGRASTGRQPMLGVQPSALHQRIGAGLRLAATRSSASSATTASPPRATPAARCSPSAACSATDDRTRATMSERHPIIAITGSSGAGTTSVTRTFENIFRREKRQGRGHRRRQLPPLRPQGDEAARRPRPRRRATALQPLRPGEQPVRRTRAAVPQLRRDAAAAGAASTCTTPTRPRRTSRSPAPSRPGRTCPPTPTCCSTKACTARWSTPEVDIARHPDLLIGVVPVINLEWIQKL